jgi:N-acetylmuramoyl-L-alanine amidase
VNFNERLTPVDILLLHYTGMPDGDQALNWLCVEESQVSCHYLVHEDGRIVQMVSESRRDWHAGAGSWRGGEDINSRSIGIEIVNPGHEFGYPDFPEIQIAAVTRLCRDIINRHAIAPRNVLAHSDVAPGRKQDPGEKFPWNHLHANGIGHWVLASEAGGGRFFSEGDSGEPVEAMQAMFALYGYGLQVNGVFDEQTGKVVRAFQQHFRQGKVDGVADSGTIETLYALIRALPTS